MPRAIAPGGTNVRPSLSCPSVRPGIASHSEAPILLACPSVPVLCKKVSQEHGNEGITVALGALMREERFGGNDWDDWDTGTFGWNSRQMREPGRERSSTTETVTQAVGQGERVSQQSGPLPANPNPD